MPDLVVVVPSRGRPEAAAELAEAFKETCSADTKLVIAVDENDPTLGEYRSLFGEDYALDRHGDPNPRQCMKSIPKPSTMVWALNIGLRYFVDPFGADPFAIGFMGDDHRPRTVGWDKEYLDALRELGTGIVYGDDLYQGEKLPTQCAMTADIVRALGYMAPPTLRHMYVDNFWLDLGRQADCLYYLPDVVVEHLHPVAGKGDWDEGYKRVNAPEVYDADAQAYDAYGREQFAADLAKVRALVAAHDA